MNRLFITKVCLLVGLGMNIVMLFQSFDVSPIDDSSSRAGWLDYLIGVQSPSANQSLSQTAVLSSVDSLPRTVIPNIHEAASQSAFYRAWNTSEVLANLSTMRGDTSKKEVVSIIVDLAGEFGNHLSEIAHGRAIQTILWQDHGVASHLVLRRNSNEEKYLRTQRQLKRCFPNLRGSNGVVEMHGPQSTSITSQRTLDRLQESWLGSNRSQYLLLNGGDSLTTTRQSVQELVSLLSPDEGRSTLWTSRPGSNEDTTTAEVKGVAFPFLRTRNMLNRELMDLFYDDFRAFFQIDEESCCGAITGPPSEEEAVFHFRNFVGELKQGKRNGLEELSASKVATEVFANRTTTGRVAIATRFPGRKAAREYYDALEAQGMDVRFLANRSEESRSSKGEYASPPSAMQDFCSMRHATELVGMVRSTFVVWAALLGEGSARLYSVDSPNTRNKFAKRGKAVFRTYNWTHPELQRRIQFELYQSEELKQRKNK